MRDERGPREDDEQDITITPDDAAKEAAREREESPEDESTTASDETRESGFGA